MIIDITLKSVTHSKKIERFISNRCLEEFIKEKIQYEQIGDDICDVLTYIR